MAGCAEGRCFVLRSGRVHTSEEKASVRGRRTSPFSREGLSFHVFAGESMNIVDMMRDLSRRHEELKYRIHNFRMPLSPAGQRFMAFVYFCVPIVGGYFIMDWATSQAEKNLGKNGEKLRALKAARDRELEDGAKAAAMLAAASRVGDGGSLDADSVVKREK